MNKELRIQNIVSGTVIHGDSYGKVLGFPTANLDRREFVRKKLKIRFGVWAGWVFVGQVNKAGQGPALHRWKAGIVIGPLDKTGLPKIEAHLVGFKGDLYGKKITVKLLKYIRPFKKFKNLEQLKSQIGRDIQRIREMEN
jgi:riboflavin kinase/FMN adenylyltransferase